MKSVSCDQVSERWSTVGTHNNTVCLLKNTSTKHNTYVVNSSIFMISASENDRYENHYEVAVTY
jgi:hypothetical protein